MIYYHRWSIPASLGAHKVDPPSSRATATVYVLAVTSIAFGLVWGYCNLFKPKRLENPGVSAYRPRPAGDRALTLITG